MTMENDLVDKWLLDFCAEVSPYIKATSPRKGVYRVESNGGVAVEFAYNFSDKAAFDHTKNVLLGVFGNRIQALEAELAMAHKERDAALDHDWVAAPAYAAKVTMCREFRDRAERAEAELARKTEALSKITKWPDGGNRYGQENIKKFARSALEEKTDV